MLRVRIEVHVASYHEVRVRRSGDHVKQSQSSDAPVHKLEIS